jgi:hypothetical protein
MKIRKNNLRRVKVLIPSLLILAVLVIGALELTNVTHFFHKSPAPANIVTKAGKKTPTPVSNVSGTTKPTTKSPTSNNGTPSGSSTDTGGAAATTTNSSQWITSKSGVITLKQPIANSTLQDGVIISGSASVSQVNFRLIDNTVGVIDQGTLNVVNGNFSGILHFQSKATSGQLDVFSTGPNAIEINEIQVSINF